MAKYRDYNDVVARCNYLQSRQNIRSLAVEQWYTMLEQVPNPDREIPDGAQVYTGNDPRTFFNYARAILTSPSIVHKVDGDFLSTEELEAMEGVKTLVKLGWKDNFRRESNRGLGEWMERLAGYILAQGQYAVYVRAYSDRLLARIWNPYQVYADYDGAVDGPSEVARIYRTSADKLYLIAKLNGWEIHESIPQEVTVYNYYAFDKGKPYHTAVVHNTVVVDEYYKEMDRLPIFVGSIGGIPGSEELVSNASRDYVYGESIVSTNYNIYKSLDRQMSFMMQVSHDFALPSWYEKTEGESIIDPDKLYTRGNVFTMKPEEDVGIVPHPAMPAEISQALIRMEDQKQRGSVPDAAFGNIPGSGYTTLLTNLVSQISESTLRPYTKAVVSLINKIDDFWVKQVVKRKLKPYGWEAPEGLPDIDRIFHDIDFRVTIPGDLAARINMMRSASPEAKLSPTTAITLLLPEVPDARVELARAYAEQIERSPTAMVIDEVLALRAKAEEIRGTNEDIAQLYETAAGMLEAKLAAGGGTEQQVVDDAPTMGQAVLPQEGEV